MEESIRQFVKLDKDDEKRIIYERLLKATYYRLPMHKIVKEEESHAILRRVKYEWSENEWKWRRLFQEQEEQTRCRATRSLSGTISYIDINTGETVSSNDYEIRYMIYAQTLKKKGGILSTENSNDKLYLSDECNKLPPLQKPPSIMSLLLSNSNIGWFPHELMQIDIPDDLGNNNSNNNDNNNSDNNNNNDYNNDINMKVEDQNKIENKNIEETFDCEFESPNTIVSSDFPLKRLKTSV